jgi:hypothetical protein
MTRFWLVLVLTLMSAACAGVHAPDDAALVVDAGVAQDGAAMCASGPEACAWFQEQASRYEHLGGCEAECPAVLDPTCAEQIVLSNNCERLREAAATCACP